MIRRATLHDLEAVVAGNQALARESEGIELDAGVVRAGARALLSGEQVGAYHLGLVDGQVVAQLMITHEWSDWRNGDVWWIQSVYVDPAHRRQGWYRRLYEHVRSAAQAAGAVGIRLYVDVRYTRAQAVYAALGMDGDHYRVFEAMFD